MRRQITLMLSALLVSGCGETVKSPAASPTKPITQPSIYSREILLDNSDSEYGEKIIRFTNTKTGKSVLVLYRGSYNSQSTVVLPSDL